MNFGLDSLKVSPEKVAISEDIFKRLQTSRLERRTILEHLAAVFVGEACLGRRNVELDRLLALVVE